MLIGRSVPNLVRVWLRKPPTIPPKVNFHAMASANANSPAPVPRNNLLVVPNVIFVQTCGFKVKGHLRKRCKDCYFVRRQERLFVLCDKSPRHKQMSMVKDEKNTWILTHATQGKVRPW